MTLEEEFDAMLMSAEDVEAEVRQFADFMRTTLTEDPRDGWTPMLMVVATPHPGGERQRIIYALAVDFNEYDERRMVLEGLGADLTKKKLLPLMALLSSEVWLAESSDRNARPRDLPNRKEGLSVFALSADGKHQMLTTTVVTRNADNHMILGEEMEFAKDGVECKILKHFFRGFARAKL